MRRRQTMVYHVSLFVLAQLVWLLCLGLWIYWYVSNYIIFQQVGDRLSPQLTAEGTSTTTLVLGLVLLVLIMILMSLIFKYLYRQVNLHKLYGNFISNVTHELKSPLASIQLHLETMALRDVPATARREFCGMLLADVGRLNGLVDTILEIAGLERSRTLYRYSVHSMETVFCGLVEESIERFRLPPGALTVSGEADCQCVIDPEALRTVFHNLLDNAIKYSPSAPVLDLRMEEQSGYFRLALKDHGIGIAAAQQKLVFDKFYRVPGRHMPSVKGVGLGLYRVREIMRAHGGRVNLASDGPGTGSTFLLELPVYPETKRRFTAKLLRVTRVRRMEDGHDD